MITEPADAALRLVVSGMAIEEAAARYDVPVAAIRQACAEQGHTYEVYSNGDPAGPYYEEWACCTRCGQDYEPEEAG